MKWILHIQIFFLYIVICQGNGTQVTNSNIRKLLSHTEWELLVGSASDYEIIHPSLHRARRSTNQQTISITGLGRRWCSTITPSNSIISHDFALLRRNENGTEDVTNQHREELECLYRGDDIAVSICDGIRGVMSGQGSEYFTIHPLPQRFQNETPTSTLHVISRRSLPNHSSVDSLMERRHINRTSAMKLNPNLKMTSISSSDEVEGILNLGSEEFLDNFTSDDSAGNGEINTSEETSETIDNFKKGTSIRDVLRTATGSANYLSKNFAHYENETEPRVRRVKRSAVSGPVFVETAVFVDRDLYKHMARNYPKNTERELIRFVLAMINAVQLLYHDSSLGQIVNFVLKRLEILHTDPVGLHRPHDIDRYLSSFCQWQGRENPGTDQDTRHWDHALMLTGLDLYVVNKRGKVSAQVVGLAPVAGMCTKTSSCTVNEGRHFESVYVVAHEIGHNLGMRHDGGTSDNECDPTSYIMSPTLGSGKITWSPCSRSYLQHFLQTTQSRCLLDHGSSGGQLDHSAEGALPGERFDSDHQCMLKYGFGSRHSTMQPLGDICRDMHCERDRYTWTSHPALEGTFCGEDKWCRGGRCVHRSGLLFTSSSKERIPGAWSAWHISECASGCLYEEHNDLELGSTGIRVILRSCNSPSPLNGGEKCSGPHKRYIACNAAQCSEIPRTTLNEFADQICTRAKEVDTDLLGTGLQRISSDPGEACTVWCHTKNRDSKSRGWTFPDGTRCRTRRNDFYKSSYCIAGRCEEFRCTEPESYKFIESPEKCYGLDTNDIDRKDDIELLSRNLNFGRVKDNWVVSSGCHFNCIAPGIGIRLVNRLKRRINETSIQLCDPDSNNCEHLKSPYEFATTICNKYKERVRRLSGLGMQISPSVEDPDRPCRVACQDDTVSHRFYLVNGENGWFPFGTACSKGNRKSFCVTGKCLEFGEDDTPLHESVFSLPLLARYKRNTSTSRMPKTKLKSAINGGRTVHHITKRFRRNLGFDKTTILSQLNQHDLDSIIMQLNFSGRPYQSDLPLFQIDLNNPIHVPLDEFDYSFYNNPRFL